MKTSSGFIAVLVMLSIAIFVWGPSPVGAWEQPVLGGSAPGDYRPGATNPVKNPARWRLLAQDTLGDITQNHTQTMLQCWNAPVDDYLQDWRMLSGSNSYSVPNCNIEFGPVAAAKGRVITPLNDDAFIAFYTNDGGAVKPVVARMSSPGSPNYVIPGDYYAAMPSGTFSTIEIATGDIDGEVDKNNERHEEIIIAYRKYSKKRGGYSVWITALKYSSTTGFIVLDSYEVDGIVGATYSFISLTTGDYDNDGIDEIALDYPYDTQYFYLCTFDYVKGTLVLKGFISDILLQNTYNLVDLTSGDFDGDGADEIAALFARCTTDNHDDTNAASVWINIYKMVGAKLERKSGYSSSQDNWFANKGAAITSGLFKYDANNSDPVARRQLATIEMYQHKVDKWQPKIRTFDVDSDFKITQASAILARGTAGNYPGKWDVACLKPEIAAGRFLTLGYQNQTLPGLAVTDQIVASWGHTPESGWDSLMIFNNYVVNPNDMSISIPGEQTGYGFASKHSDIEFSVYNTTSVSIVAACTEEGKSYYLGVPAHITIPKIISAIRIIQEPPKHLDYLPAKKCKDDETCTWGIVNVSKRTDFFASFEESKTLSIETTSQSQTDWDIGGSEEASAKETFEEGIPDIDGGKLTASESEGVSYDYKSVTSKLNGNYSAVTAGESFDTSTDDALQLKTMWMDIWRYPIYGLKTTKGKNAFYEVVLPGNEVYMNVPGTGCSDYYQPIHENGNLLSYPWITDSKFPYDLGSFQVTGVKLPLKKVMTLPQDLTYGSNLQTWYVDWVDESWTTETSTQTKTLSESADFKLGFSGTASALIAGGSWSIDVDLSFHNENSWSNTSYSESKTTMAGKVTVQVPAAGAEYDYQFRPILYTTTDGTLKLAHTAAPGSTATFWQQHYHGKSDLSLNLPMKYWWKESNDEEKLGIWYFYAYRQERSRMRGIFLYTNDPETNKGKVRYLAGSPTAGETIYVQTYVYNYSLDTETGPFIVRFSYAPYNANLEDGAPDLTTIGDVEVTSGLSAQERKEVSIKWDIAKDLGGDEPGAGKPYVIYVTLDPDNEVQNEIHELYVKDQSPAPSGQCPTDENEYSEGCGIFCASNNQGYWPWDNTFMIFAPKTAEGNDNGSAVDVSIVQESLEVEFTAESEGYGDYIFARLPYRLKLKVLTEKAIIGFREVLFYDNDKVFSMKRVFGLNPGENDFYCRWSPDEPGEHTLKVVVSEDEDDPQPENAVVTLDVNVLKFQRPLHR